jgi:hypothetical protein
MVVIVRGSLEAMGEFSDDQAVLARREASFVFIVDFSPFLCVHFTTYVRLPSSLHIFRLVSREQLTVVVSRLRF